jgi:hypothetical protein
MDTTSSTTEDVDTLVDDTEQSSLVLGGQDGKAGTTQVYDLIAGLLIVRPTMFSHVEVKGNL